MILVRVTHPVSERPARRRWFLALLVAPVFLGSCSANKFYADVHTGTIRNAPIVRWNGPDEFELVSPDGAPFEFRRYNGEVIRPNPIYTDGGSIPKQFWSVQGMTPWTYAPAYLIHDWLYEANRRQRMSGGRAADGKPLYYTRDQADLILAEVIKTQMNDETRKAEDDPSAMRLYAIYWAVRRFGDRPFNGEAKHVENPVILSGIGRTIGAVVPDLVKTPLKTLGNQAQPLPLQPQQEGHREPVPAGD